MALYINNIISDSQVTTDIKTLIPDAGVRRRMSRVVKFAVAAAVECVGGVEKIDDLDAIITATGFGCLADSEKFLRNIINDKEELLNPTPFIQSTFNTVGGQIAMARHNHCYNMTYVNRGHSFEDALLDAYMKAADGEASRILVGGFDERTDSQYRIMERMGAWRKKDCGEGAVFAFMTSSRTEESFAEVAGIHFPDVKMSAEECLARYASSEDCMIVTEDTTECGKYPTASSVMFAKAAELIAQGNREVLVYNTLFNATPAVTILRCIG